jgi:serine/threonine-protein kinase
MAEGLFIDAVLRRSGRSFDIFAAIDATGRKVAVKRARNPTGLDRPRFAREAQLGRALRHAGLASVLDHAPDQIVFEWLEGSLLDHERTAALRGLRDVAETLAHMHACGVVHRDIKPAHIMFRDDRAVLIDLGVAGLVGGRDRLDIGEIVGSPAWMAPEQMLGAAPEPSADIWSLCAVAHRVLNGRQLYAGTADRVLAARRTAPQPRPDFSSLADRRLADALQVGFADPADRPSAREIAAALSSVIDSRESEPAAAAPFYETGEFVPANNTPPETGSTKVS